MTWHRLAQGVDRVASGEVALDRAAHIALLTNRAARTSDGRWTGDATRAAGYRIALFLSPEHGLDVAAGAGAAVGHGRLDGIPVLSLYGAEWEPVEEAMAGIDIVVADLPCVYDPNAIGRLHLTVVIPWISKARKYMPRRPSTGQDSS